MHVAEHTNKQEVLSIHLLRMAVADPRRMHLLHMQQKAQTHRKTAEVMLLSNQLLMTLL